MQEFIIQKEEAGQTVMKYLARLLPEASMGLLRKSMRKKNIVLNGKKIEGREKIAAGDSVKVWFSDETIEKFRKKKEESPKRDYPDFEAWVLYEDENIVILNKPAGLLSQGDTSGAPSLNEALLSARESGGSALHLPPAGQEYQRPRRGRQDRARASGNECAHQGTLPHEGVSGSRLREDAAFGDFERVPRQGSRKKSGALYPVRGTGRTSHRDAI